MDVNKSFLLLICSLCLSSCESLDKTNGEMDKTLKSIKETTARVVELNAELYCLSKIPAGQKITRKAFNSCKFEYIFKNQIERK